MDRPFTQLPAEPIASGQVLDPSKLPLSLHKRSLPSAFYDSDEVYYRAGVAQPTSAASSLTLREGISEGTSFPGRRLPAPAASSDSLCPCGCSSGYYSLENFSPESSESTGLRRNTSTSCSTTGRLVALHRHFQLPSGHSISTSSYTPSLVSSTAAIAKSSSISPSVGSSSNNSSGSSSNSSSSASGGKSPIFPSTRFFIAILLCLCFCALSISTSNLSVSMVCMVKRHSPPSQQQVPYPSSRVKREDIVVKDVATTNLSLSSGNTSSPSTTLLLRDQLTECQLARIRKHAPPEEGSTIVQIQSVPDLSSAYVQLESCYDAEKLEWTSTDQGIVFAAQNAGSLFMLVTGVHADRLNSKWTIVLALSLLILSNILLPLIAHVNVWLVVGARLLTGLSDALLQPSTSSLITRWFPPKERPFAIGLITGGRQIGTLLILPVAGFLCSRHDILNGWPAIFYLSAMISTVILMAWLLMSADKPSKHFATSFRERSFVEEKIAEDRLGKRRERKSVPWRQLLCCWPLHVGVAALICHEYPLVIMLQLLPKYINDVLHLPPVANGFVSALPIAVLFLSKTLFSSLAALLGSRKKGRLVIGRTPLSKIFNGIASLGLGICVGIVPLLNSERHIVLAVLVLCCANGFAGLHTPGVQTALLQLAPAYTGIITGIAFGCVAIFGIINKILSNFIVKSGSVEEWSIVFWIAAVIALLPVFFFTLWGSADRQPWATSHHHLRRRRRGSGNMSPTSSPSLTRQAIASPSFNGYLPPAVDNRSNEDSAIEEGEAIDEDESWSAESITSALQFRMPLNGLTGFTTAAAEIDGIDGRTKVARSHSCTPTEELRCYLRATSLKDSITSYNSHRNSSLSI